MNDKSLENKANERPLYQMLYVSRVRYSALFRYDVFHKIGVTSKKNNKAQNITSILCFGHGFFLQYCEGSEQDLTNLKNALLQDSRHHSIDLFLFSILEERRFPNVYQGFVLMNKGHQKSKKILRPFLPMTPHKWNLDKQLHLIDLIKAESLFDDKLRLSNVDEVIMRIVLLVQLLGDNFNFENRIFWLSASFFTSLVVGFLIVLFSI